MTVIEIVMMMTEKKLMITSTITILCEGNKILTYETKKPRNDEDLARRLRRTDGRTDKPAYKDARTHLKSKWRGPLDV